MRRLILLLAAFALCGATAFAQSGIPLTAVTEGSFGPLPELADAVRRLDAAVSLGDAAAADEQLAAVRDWKGRLSANDFYFVSDFLRSRSYTLAREGKTAEAALAAHATADVSPDYAAAWFTLAGRNFKRDVVNYGGWFNPFVTGVKAYFADPLAKRAFGYNLITLGIFSLFGGFIAFIAAATYANAGPLIQDIRRIFPMASSAKLAVGALLLFLLALVAGVGIFAALLVLPLLLAGHLNWQGRAVTLVFLALVAALPFVGGDAGKGIALLTSREARAADRFITGGFEPDDIKEFETSLRRHPNDVRLMYILGAMNRRLERYEEAEGYLTRALQLDQKSVPALVEMGNLYFNRGEFRDAEIMYRNALGLAPSSFEGHYNLAAAYLEQFRTEESNAELDAASRIDTLRTNRLIAAKEGKFAPKVVSVRLGANEFPATVERAVGDAAAGLGAKAREFFLWPSGRNAHLIVLAAYIAAFAAAIGAWRVAGAHGICPSCGATFMPMFSKVEKGVVKCNQCVALASPKKSTVFGLKDKKTRQILGYQTARRETANLLNIIMPGLGFAWRGSFALGAILLIVSAGFWANLLGWGVMLAAGYRPAPAFVYGGLLALMALYYLAAAPLSYWRK